MGVLNRRQFLNRGLPVTVGFANRQLCRGFSNLFAFSAPAANAAIEATNLIANGDFSKGTFGSLPDNWSVVAGNPALKPSFKLVAGPNGNPELMAESNGRQECYGYVRHQVKLMGGKTYRMRASFRFSNVEDVNRSLVHGVFTDKFNNGIFRYRREG